MAWQPEGATGVFKHKCRCVALWELVVDQLTDQSCSAPICTGAVWGLWLWHFKATSQEVASGASTQLGQQTLGWWPHQDRREHGVEQQE